MSQKSLSVPVLLIERNKSHGSWRIQSQTAQHLKAVLAAHCCMRSLSSSQREALDMIATKLARIMCGDPNHSDHWKDIAGYAELVANELDLEQENKPDQTELAGTQKRKLSRKGHKVTYSDGTSQIEK